MKILSDNESQLIIRFDKDENLIEKLKEVASAKQIQAATFSGIGATKKVTLSYFDLEKKEYLDREFEENLEILSLNGNIAHAENEEIIIHVHGVFGNVNYSTIGGHIKELIVSVTCEITLIKADNRLNRQVNKEFGLKLLD